MRDLLRRMTAADKKDVRAVAVRQIKKAKTSKAYKQFWTSMVTEIDTLPKELGVDGERIRWVDAFDKFGFEDGDGQVYTNRVALFISEFLNAEVEYREWSCHNTVIRSIRLRDSWKELLHGDIDVGYDDPRVYLPKDLVAALDEHFGPSEG